MQEEGHYTSDVSVNLAGDLRIYKQIRENYHWKDEDIFVDYRKLLKEENITFSCKRRLKNK